MLPETEFLRSRKSDQETSDNNSDSDNDGGNDIDEGDWLMKERQESEVQRTAICEELLTRYPKLEAVKTQMIAAYQVLEHCYEQGGKLLIAGNGGSSADAEHIVGELMKGFVKRRELPAEFQARLKAISPEHGELLGARLQGGLPAIALNGHPGLATAFLNDVDGEMIYAQQVCGYGTENDVLLALSTSGNAKNIDYAVTAAKAKGMRVIALSGKDGGKLSQRADVAIVVPEQETFKIQELHLPVYHALCLMLEERFF